MASKIVRFNGFYFSPAGDKSRFVVPPAFRKKLIEASHGDRVLCVKKDPKQNCLNAFGTSREDALSEQLERDARRAEDRGDEFDYLTRSQQLFGYVDIKFDESGRFVLPKFLANLADIDTGIAFVGNGPELSLWNPDELFKMGPAWNATQQAIREQIELHEAKKK